MTEPDDTPTEILVPGDHPYPVVVGRGLLGTLGVHLGTGVQKVLIVHPPTLGAAAAELRESLLGQYEVLLAEIPDAEAGKRVEVAAFCWQVLGQADFTRSDAVIGFGGGAVTDVAGFVAATWLRGVRLVQVPTTLLGMVDASVGGKTGINTAEGKNLVGAFYAPAAVVADLDTLDSLSRNEILAGFAEVVKCGFIADPEILDIIEADVDRATDPRTPEFRRLVELSIGIKARVVGEDFTRVRAAGDPQLRTHARPRDRARGTLPVAPRGGRRGRDDVRCRACAAERPALRRGRRPAQEHPRVAEPAGELPARALADPARDDAA